ncbi:helix-turn-helix domain-containing protein [Nonomuraea angiospora]|uniref:helix-turn-helix domain-containing protein n=1 Tax=Nonomuraea angiospora TaxID=46172 RepID=UPI0033E31A56
MATTTAPPAQCVCGGCICGGDPALFYELSEVMTMLRISRSSAYKLIRTGQLESKLVLTQRKVFRKSFRRYLAKRDDLAAVPASNG